MAYQELTPQSIEILKQLRDRGKADTLPPAGNTEEAIIDHLREIKTELIGHGVTTEIGMILRGCILAQESDNPFDHPMDRKIDETYFDWLQEFRNRDRRLQITPLNCMATILYEQENLTALPFEKIVTIYNTATDLAGALRLFYADDPGKRLPDEFGM